MSRPVGSAVAASSTVIVLALPRQGGAGRARRGEEADLVETGKLRSAEDRAHDCADLTGCTDDTDSHDRKG